MTKIAWNVVVRNVVVTVHYVARRKLLGRVFLLLWGEWVWRPLDNNVPSLDHVKGARIEDEATLASRLYRGSRPFTPLSPSG